MPELPEVQTIINDLNQKIQGDKIVGFWSDWGKAIKNKSAEKFTKEIQNRKILRARRIGKNIFLDLSGGPACNASRSDAGRKTIYIHLKMTGHLLVKTKSEKLKAKSYFDDKVNQYIHHIWKLKNKNGKLKTLEFSDLRKFGKIVLVDTGEVNNLKEIKTLGTDALDEKFTLEKFEEILKRKKNLPIGILLMEQSLISGIGNIYRSEILFDARIHPSKKAEKINSQEKRALFKSIKKILEKAVKLRGTSDSDYRDTSGAPGSFQKALRVYRKEKKSCSKCGTIIKRYKLGQRSVFICEKCQR